MKQIELTQGKVALVDDEDFETFNQFKWHCAYFGSRNCRLPYASRKADHKTISMHRLIAETPKGMFTDHIDGNTLNNQKHNLRVCTLQQNNHSRRININNTAGYKGVTKHGKKWKAQIKYSGRKVYLGTYDSPKEAHENYIYVAKQLFGEFTKAV